jgi:ribose transport system substrate-binding protein
MLTRRLSCIALCVAVAVALLVPINVGAQKQVTLAYTVPTLNSEFFVTMGKGAQQAAKDFGAKLLYQGANLDVNAQIKQVEDFIQQKVDVLLIQGADSAGIVTALDLAQKANIPVVTSGDKPKGGKIRVHIGFNNYETGEIAAGFIAKALNGKGNVVELIGRLGTETGRQKSEGVRRGFAKFAGLKLVASQPANFERATAVTVMENILQAQPSIDGLYAANDDMALGAVQAMKAANRLKGVVIVGTDGIDDAVDAIKRGEMAATIATPPFRQGYIAAETAIRLARGQPVPDCIKEFNQLISRGNLDQADVIRLGVKPAERYWDPQYAKPLCKQSSI